MAAKLHTYSPKLFVLTYGADTISGFADGTWLQIEEMGDGTVSESGADGDVARAMSTDERVSVTMTLQQTSASNDALTWYYQSDKDTGGNFPQPFMVKDLRGTTMASGIGWVTKIPEASYSKGLETREWILEGVGKIFVGGSL